MANINFIEYFKEEHPVYCQNISDCNVSVMFEVGSGLSESYLFTANRDPVDLTQRFPFATIKNSMDLRKMLNRVPTTLVLLSQEDFDAYYANKAERAGVSVSVAFEEAEKARRAVQQHTIAPPAAPDESDVVHKKIADEQVMAEDEINSKVLNLMLQVHGSLPDQQKLPSAQVLETLETISGSLGVNDWAYVQSHGYYKSVSQYAAKKLASLTQENSESGKAKKKKTK